MTLKSRHEEQPRLPDTSEIFWEDKPHLHFMRFGMARCISGQLVLVGWCWAGAGLVLVSTFRTTVVLE